MTDKAMLGLLQKFFDGTVLSAEEVVHLTGLPLGEAREVYRAILRLRAGSYV